MNFQEQEVAGTLVIVNPDDQRYGVLDTAHQWVGRPVDLTESGNPGVSATTNCTITGMRGGGFRYDGHLLQFAVEGDPDPLPDIRQRYFLSAYLVRVRPV